MSPRKTLSQTRPVAETKAYTEQLRVMKRSAEQLNPTGQPLTELRKLTLLKAQLERAIRATLLQARGDGGGWTEMGGALGISPQGAQQMHAKSVAPKI